MAKLDLNWTNMFQDTKPKLSPQDLADMEAYKTVQRKELMTPVETYKPANFGDVVSGVQKGKGFLGKVGGGLTALLNYANTSEGKKYIAGMGSAGMAPGMLKAADVAGQREEGLKNAAISKESQRKQNIMDLIKSKELEQSDYQKTIAPKILEGMQKMQEDENKLPSQKAAQELAELKLKQEQEQKEKELKLAQQKETQSAAEFNAQQVQQAQEANRKNFGLLKPSTWFSKVKPQTVNTTSSGVVWRKK